MSGYVFWADMLTSSNRYAPVRGSLVGPYVAKSGNPPKDSKEESNLISRGLRAVLKFLFLVENSWWASQCPRMREAPASPLYSQKLGTQRLRRQIFVFGVYSFSWNTNINVYRRYTRYLSHFFVLFKIIPIIQHTRIHWHDRVVKRARYPIWGRSLIKNFGHVRDMVDF